MPRTTTRKRNTELNMTPVRGVHPTVVGLYKRCEGAGLSMRQLCALARPKVHHDVPARWRRGATQPTVRVLQHLLNTLEKYERDQRA